MRVHSHATALKMLASVLLVAGAAGVAGLGTFGGFTSTTSATQSVSAGTVVMNLSQHASLGTTVAANGIVPGDTIQRSVRLTQPASSQNFGTVRLTTTAQTSNVLTTDATNGLQLVVDLCTQAWVASGNNLTCPGTMTTPLSSRPFIGSNLALPQVANTMNSSADAHLRLTLSLPTSAGDNFQGVSNLLTFTFDATQRAGQAK